MFGYVVVNKPELKIKDFDRYRGYYCGLCHAIKERHGNIARLTLNYDMTFLVMLLSDLYDRPCEEKCSRCVVHPMSKHCSSRNEISDYCADMCILLSYYKCLDDWNDEHKLKSLIISKFLKRKAKKVEALYPEKSKLIFDKMNSLAEAEAEKDVPMDYVARLFGEVLAAAFCYKDDYWKNDLERIGLYLGKFIYLLDAFEDIELDIKTGDYNPFKMIHGEADFEKQVLDWLLLMIGEVTDAFERLPLIDNAEILRNILYSGVWTRYYIVEKKRSEQKEADRKDMSLTDGSI